MRRKLHLLEGFEQHDFLKIMRKMRHGRNRVKLFAMYHIQAGKSLTAVSNSSKGTLVYGTRMDKKV